MSCSIGKDEKLTISTNLAKNTSTSRQLWLHAIWFVYFQHYNYFFFHLLLLLIGAEMISNNLYRPTITTCLSVVSKYRFITSLKIFSWNVECSNEENPRLCTISMFSVFHRSFFDFIEMISQNKPRLRNYSEQGISQVRSSRSLILWWSVT